MLIAASVLPMTSAQSVCQPGWTQTPASSAWGQKCYKEFGPTAEPMGNANDVCDCGYNYAECKAHCAGQSASARVMCPASKAEITFVSNQAHVGGWIAYTQDSSRSDYAEPAGGWGWECGSTYDDVPWELQPNWGSAQPDDESADQHADVSCTLLTSNGTFMDVSCIDGGTGSTPWFRSACIFAPFPNLPA